MLELILTFLLLTVIEVILGIDNIIVVSIIASRFNQKVVRNMVRITGLVMSIIFRLLMLFFIIWFISFDKKVLFSILWFSFTANKLVFLLGGIFLLYKSVLSLYDEIVAIPPELQLKKTKVYKSPSITGSIIEILIIDFVFSLDSLMVAISVTDVYFIIALAIIIAVLVMIYFSELVTKLLVKYKDIKIVALSFVLLLAGFLIAQGLSLEFNKLYIYFAVGFASIVQGLIIFADHIRNKKYHDNQ